MICLFIATLAAIVPVFLVAFETNRLSFFAFHEVAPSSSERSTPNSDDPFPFSAPKLAQLSVAGANDGTAFSEQPIGIYAAAMSESTPTVSPTVEAEILALTPTSTLAQEPTASPTAVSTPTATPQRARGLQTYAVAVGDTVSGIATRFGVSMETIIWANGLEDADAISIGDPLVILPVSGVIHVVRAGDTLEAIAAKYEASTKTVLDSSGNALVDPDRLSVGMTLILPGGKLPETTPTSVPPTATRVATRPPSPTPTARPPSPTATLTSIKTPTSSKPPGSASPTATAAKPSPSPTATTVRPTPSPTPTARSQGTPVPKRFVWPVAGSITQGYSTYHRGLDIAAPLGAPVVTADGGVVISAQQLTYDFGWNLVVDHGGGLTTRYSHVSKFLVAQGQQVTRGQQIALVGSTGRSTGPHLDFRVYQNGSPVDPMLFLP
ncbi:MAG: LysM peptidoglycan-binding domain-containing M23 family metallopeptidase [Chloroflexi bacterium]|nr:LysM peptidoglycan-binding domain-containing M23 family metallopeptidase [Chloroflexota bacterium]